MFRIVSLSIVLTLIVVLGITFFRVVSPYLMPLFVAGVTAILAQPLFQYFVRRTDGKVRLASGLATATVVLAILVPIAVVTAVASAQIYVFASDVTSLKKWEKVLGSVQGGAQQRTDNLTHWLTDRINEFRNTPLVEPNRVSETIQAWESGDSVEGDAGKDVDAAPTAAEALAAAATGPAARLQPVTPEEVQTLIRSKAQQLLISLGDRSLGFVRDVVFSLISGVVALLIFTVALYYFFADGTALIAATEKLVPVHVEYQREMLDQFARVVRAVVSATFLAALGQALATVLALWLCGFNHLLTLFVLCLLASMIPMLGTWLVWGPCVVVLALGGHWVSAGLLTIYGVGVVGMLDNVIRTYVLNTDTKLHPLLALISVLGGLQVMGLWGVFLGPIVASCLHALVKIFNHEVTELSRSRFGQKAGDVADAIATVADEAANKQPSTDDDPKAGTEDAPSSPADSSKSEDERKEQTPRQGP